MQGRRNWGACKTSVEMQGVGSEGGHRKLQLGSRSSSQLKCGGWRSTCLSLGHRAGCEGSAPLWALMAVHSFFEHLTTGIDVGPAPHPPSPPPQPAAHWLSQTGLSECMMMHKEHLLLNCSWWNSQHKSAVSQWVKNPISIGVPVMVQQK